LEELRPDYEPRQTDDDASAKQQAEETADGPQQHSLPSPATSLGLAPGIRVPMNDTTLLSGR
jgi:uncharacterized protein YcnI